jgi:EAL domain-containing protein (putative c-di-GMP-specific phosphodiesterase class I)
LHFQPIVAVHDRSVVAVETLLRLRDDDGNLLHPSSFVAAAEELGLLVDIEHSVIRNACRQAKLWEQAGYDLRLSVNVSVRQLADIDGFESALLGALEDNKLPARKLTCEITEHASLDASSHTLQGMRRLVAAGVDFSVDDFGTGFGSMTYLRAMPISEIKIDRSFITHAPSERTAAAIVRAHAILASELGVRCVAEGVETQDQHAFVASVGVGFAQGYLYQDPVPGDQLLERLAALTSSAAPSQLTSS